MLQQRHLGYSSPGPFDHVMKCAFAYLLASRLRYVLYVLQHTMPERTRQVVKLLLTNGSLSYTSANFAKLSFILTSINPRPSAARRLSKGIVYPLEFYSHLRMGK